MNLAETIRLRRAELKLSLRQLSDLTGISHSHIRDIEKGKYTPTMDNALKLVNVLNLELQDFLIQAYQANLRDTLIELIELCHKHEVRIPYDKWLKSNLPMQPLGIEGTEVNDAAFEISTTLYKDPDKEKNKIKLSTLKDIVDANYDTEIYTLLPEIARTLQVTQIIQGKSKVISEVRRFESELNDSNTYEMNKHKGDD